MFEDLQHIVPDLAKVSKKNSYILVGAVVGSLVIISLGLSVGIGILASRPKASQTGDLNLGPHAAALKSGKRFCLTKGCLQSAGWMLENLDTSTGPCEDFYQYACGRWLVQNQPVPPTKFQVTILSKLRRRNAKKHWELIEAPLLRNSPNSYERKLKQFFNLCKDEYSRMKDNGKLVIDKIRTNLKGWYVLDPQGWTSGGWTLQNALIEAHSTFLVPILFMLQVKPDHRDYSRNIIAIRGVDTYEDSGISEHPLLPESVAAYEAYMRAVAELVLRDAGIQLDVVTKKARIDQFVADVKEQEQKIIDVHEQSGGTWRKWGGMITTLAELNRNYTKIDFVQILSRMFAPAGVTQATQVQVPSITYIRLLDQMLRNETTNSDRIMNNYIVWVILNSYSEFLSWDYRHLRYQYLEALTGSSDYPTNWETCMHLTKGHLGYAVIAEFAKNNIGDQGREKLEQMFESLKSTLIKRVDQLPWMDEQTKVLAKQKVHAMTGNTAYPSMLSDNQQMDAMYNALKVNTSETFMHNLFYSNVFINQMLNTELTSGHSLGIWEYVLYSYTFGTWVHYFWTYNTLLVPPGIAQVPYFHGQASSALNFGGIGLKMATQLMKAVDERGGRLWNVTSRNWWTADTTQDYRAKANCLRDYFGNQTAGPFLVEGKNQTVPIKADRNRPRIVSTSGGIRLAYQAYMDWVQSKQDGGLLPGLNMTEAQTYFVVTAQTQCIIRRPKDDYRMAKYGIIPVKTLLNGVLRHIPEFSSAFNCKPPNKMVVKDQCPVF